MIRSSVMTHLTVSGAVLTLGLGITAIAPVQAFTSTLVTVPAPLPAPVQVATIPLGYNITVSIDSAPAGGILAGESYFGSFLIDDTDFTGIGEEFLPVSNLMFTFEGTVYTEADADAPPEAAFLDGEFLGLGYSVTASPFSFAFVQGFFSLDEAFFAYDGNTSGGFGDITYTEVPEPLTILGTLTAVGMGTYFKNKRKS